MRRSLWLILGVAVLTAWVLWPSAAAEAEPTRVAGTPEAPEAATDAGEAIDLTREEVQPIPSSPTPVLYLDDPFPILDLSAKSGVLDVQVTGGAVEGAKLMLELLGPENSRTDYSEILGNLELSQGLIRLEHLPAGEWRAGLYWPETGVYVFEDRGEKSRFRLGDAPALATFTLPDLGVVDLTILEPGGVAWTGPVLISIEPLQVPDRPHDPRVVAERQQAPYRLTGMPVGRWALYVRRGGPLASERPSTCAQCQVKVRATATVTITLAD